MKLIVKLALASFILFSVACKKKDTPSTTPVTITNVTINTSLPSVSTVTVLASDDVSVTVKGSVTSEGSSALTAVGVCIDTLPAPTTLRLHSNEGAGTGTYQSFFTALKANTKYYVRAYATNATGTAYGAELNFTTPGSWELVNFTQGSGALLYFNSTLFAGSSNGIFSSTDEAVTWKNSGLSSVSVNCFATANSIIYAGTYSYGVYKSANGGASWTAMNGGLTDPYINCLAAQGSTLFAASYSGLFISVNNGFNWTSISNFPAQGINCLAFNGTQIFAGANNGLYVSSNNGGSWTSVNVGTLNDGGVFSLCFTGSNLLASFSSGNLYLSSDIGVNWSQVSTIKGSTILSFATKDNEVYGGGYGTAFVSKDNGLTFKEIRGGLNVQSYTGMAITDKNVFAGSSYLYRRSR